MRYKNNYIVEFWYNTDLRSEWSGYAYDEVSAFVLAGEELDLKSWCSNGKEFKVTIRQAA